MCTSLKRMCVKTFRTCFVVDKIIHNHATAMKRYIQSLFQSAGMLHFEHNIHMRKLFRKISNTWLTLKYRNAPRHCVHIAYNSFHNIKIKLKHISPIYLCAISLYCCMFITIRNLVDCLTKLSLNVPNAFQTHLIRRHSKGERRNASAALNEKLKFHIDDILLKLVGP